MWQTVEIPSSSTSQLPLSPATKAGGFVFVSGQGSVSEQGEIVTDTFAGEMRRSMENVATILSSAGLDFGDIVQVRSYVRDPNDLPEYNKIYREYFKSPFPARTTLTNCLPEFLKFEIDVVAQTRD